MSATDEIRRLLDKRGVEYTVVPESMCSREYIKIGTIEILTNGCDEVAVYHLTPEQAVEATLGMGTCEILGYDDGYDEGVDGEMYQYADPRYFLSCEHEAYGSVVPKYCPECGRKVLDEWA